MDKYIEKIRELKRENMKLKKYKVFVEKSKDSKSIYDQIKNLQIKLEKKDALETRCKHLLSENKILQSKVSKLQRSELSFANKSNFYKQQIEINQLEENIEKLKDEYKNTFERNKKLEMIVEKLADVFSLCEFDAELSD